MVFTPSAFLILTLASLVLVVAAATDYYKVLDGQPCGIALQLL